MLNNERSKHFTHLFNEEDKVYGNEKDQSALFEDVIPWPDPDKNDQYYNISKINLGYDNIFDYNLNRLNFREPKLSKNSDILAVGCSNSFGVGLPYDLAWPETVSKALNLTYSNISLPGTSVMHQVMNIFHYCKAFGNPKIILCVFPNFERSRMFVDNRTTHSKNQWEKEPAPVDIHTNAPQNRPTFLKLPVDKDELISEQQAFYYNTLFIFMLEQYCRSNQIKLIWSTWADHDNFDLMFKETYEYYESGMKEIFIKNVYNCNNHDNLKFKYSEIFNEAADSYKKNPHPGVHWHQHVAEFFVNKIKKDLS
jgi:hypothetical protein